MTIGTSGPDTLTGGAGSDLLEGLGGNDILDGAGGIDETRGGAGDDLHYIDNSSDLVIEAAGEGVDTVYARATFVLGANVENLVLRGSDPINGTGNSLANTITGNSAANILNGGTGADKLKGGAGNDTFHVDNVSDRAIETSGGGVDLVFSTVSFAIVGEVENLTLTGGAAINGTGNALANLILGNSAANVINGGAGADEMRGGAGNDSYVVDNVADLVVEGSGNGTDLVTSSISYTLGAYQENLTLTGLSEIDGTGNGLANILLGNKGANVLNGGAGADQMRGAAGDDTYIVDNAGDTVVEGSNRGTDTVQGSVSFALGAYVENLILTGAAAIDGTGNGLANQLTGNAAANILDGGAGDDLLNGGGGGDRLVGGSELDVFEFTAALGSGNVDLVDDFNTVNDTIRLGGTASQAFVLLASGALGTDAFRIGSAATDADDRIIYNSVTGALLYDADGIGGVAGVQFATLDGGLALTAADFMVTGPANHLPTISSGSAASVEEDLPASTIIYQTVASDSDGDAIAYTLAGADAALFRIDRNGAVRFVTSPDVDADSSYNFTVRAEDSSGNGASRAVTLTVTNVDESADPYLVNETAAANDTRFSAQALDRNLFTIADSPNVPNDSLPTAIINGNVSIPGDKDFFSITLQAGELLILDIDGTATLDAWLTVYDTGGNILTFNDDPGGPLDPGSTSFAADGHNMDSFIKFRAPSDGTYYVSVESFFDEAGPSSDGAYTLNLSVGPPASQDEINQENIEALFEGASWSDFDLTYGFPNDPSDYGPGEGVEEIDAGMSQLNAQQRSAVTTILAQYANLTNLTFALAATPGNADLRYALSNDPETAHAYPPYAFSGGDGGDSWYNTTEYTNPVVGNYQWMAFVHETGHALGLKHGHESPALSSDRDSLEFSVMTYRSYIGASVDAETGGYTNETFGYPQTLMMYDIGALQQLYGADFTIRSGNTVYSWNPSTGAFLANGVVQWTPGGNRVFMTLWDGNGVDTYDLSNYGTITTIDLRPGEWSKTSYLQLANLGDGNMARGNVANALLYNDDTRSLIENAIGGTDNDLIIANQAVNRLTGNTGQDQFRWYSVTDSPLGAADTITDHSGDIINLVGIDAIKATPGDDAFTLIHSNPFSGTAGELRLEANGNVLNIFGDVDGDMIADLHIIVQSSDGEPPWIPDSLFML